MIRPDGSPLTLVDLPAPGLNRWVVRRKAEVIAGRLDHPGQGLYADSVQDRHLIAGYNVWLFIGLSILTRGMRFF